MPQLYEAKILSHYVIEYFLSYRTELPFKKRHQIYVFLIYVTVIRMKYYMNTTHNMLKTYYNSQNQLLLELKLLKNCT